VRVQRRRAGNVSTRNHIPTTREEISVDLHSLIQGIKEQKETDVVIPESTLPVATPVNESAAAAVHDAPRASTIAPGTPPTLQAFKQYIHNLFVSKIDPEDLNRIPEARRRTEIRNALEHLVEADGRSLSHADKTALVGDLLDDILGFGPLEKFLRDPLIGDILINGHRSAYIERHGVLEGADLGFRDDHHLMEVIHRIVSRVGRRVNESSPMVDARLPDGSRLNAIIPPLALNGPMVSIRRFGVHPLRFSDLVAMKSLTPEMATYLEAAVRARLNLLISGGTGSGKTTLLNALSAFIQPHHRVITIEDAAELRLQQHHVGSLEARPENVEGKGEVTIRQLLCNSLRMRPDRIVIGECRGAEALDMLQAMNTGHEGSMTTLHANSPRDALSRLEMMIMMSGLELPLRAMRQQIASSVNVILQTDRVAGGGRRLTSITEVVGMEQETISLQELFAYRASGVDPSGRCVGQFEATGIRSHYDDKMRAAGVSLNPELYWPRVLLRV
jgi:pilus assembly protein CpaF